MSGHGRCSDSAIVGVAWIIAIVEIAVAAGTHRTASGYSVATIGRGISAATSVA